MDNSVKEIELKEISPEAIKNIRDLRESKSNPYKVLKKAIERDGQLHPIILRELTKSELENAEEGAKYGIVDGHHRYRIALELKKETILAEILPNMDNENDMYYRDTSLAFRVNASNIKMNKKDKGKIISDLLDKSAKNITEIGKEIFGVGKTAAYDYLMAHRNLTESENNEKQNDGNLNTIKDTRGRKVKELEMDTLLAAWEILPKTEKEYTKKDFPFESRLKYAKAIRTIETQLRKLRKHVFTDEVKKALEAEDRKASQSKNEKVEE